MKLRVLLLAFIALAVSAAAQYVPSRWGDVQTFPHGYVDLSNLDVHLVFPIYTRATGSRAQLQAKLIYDSDIWQDQYGAWEPVGGALHGTPGWRFQANTGAVVKEAQDYNIWCYTPDGVPDGEYNLTQFTFTAPDGTTASVGTYETGCQQTTATSTTTVVQASGDTYTVYTTASGGVSATDSEGDNVLDEFEDPSGNTVSASTSPNSFTGTYTDPLGTALTITGTYPYYYTYTGPDGSPTTITENFETINVSADFGCYTAYSGSITVVQSIQYPGVGTYSFGYSSAGQLDSMTLPTGGTIYFNATESCLSGTVSGTLSRWESSDGSAKQWSWINNGTQTTETTPSGDQSLYTFDGGVLQSVQQNQGPLAGGTGESATTISSGWGDGYIASQTATTELLGATPLYSVQSVSYDPYGHITSSSTTNWGTSPSGGTPLRSVAAVWSVSANGADLEQSQLVYGPSGDTESSTSWAYDYGDEVVSTTQQTGSGALTTAYAYNSNGTLASVTAPNGAVTAYTNYTCGSGLFPQSISYAGILTTSASWNCTGGVEASTTDANGNTTSYSYGGPGNTWLPSATVIPGPYTINYSYGFPSGAPSSVESSMLFNGGNSMTDTRTTTDTLGRPVLVQHRQGPSSSQYDSVETQYDAMGRVAAVSQPYAAAAGALSGSDWISTTYDAFSRPLSVTDAAGGYTDFSYTLNDTLITRGPASANAPLVSRQEQFDALGRLESVCEVNPWPSGEGCGQTVSGSGYHTGYTRNARGEITGVNDAAEHRIFAYDEMGRLTEATNPESGTITYYYGSSAPGCTAQPGNLAERVDNAGNVTCYSHDLLNRVTEISYPSGPNASVTPARYFVYDAATVDGEVMTNAAGRLADAYTVLNGVTQTDLGLGYDVLGHLNWRLADMPHAPFYYQTAATVQPNGAVTEAWAPYLDIRGTLDGEGRLFSQTSTEGSFQQVVSAVDYNAAGEATSLSYGNGDSDRYSYDAATGRRTGYQFTVNGATDTGTLGWSASGALVSRQVADQVAGTQDTRQCSYGHDDLGRLSGVSCNDGWGQTFAFDRYGNLTKTGSQSFGAVYNVRNQISGNLNFVPDYDGDGDLLDDPVTGERNANAYDAEGRAVSLEGVTVLYDALGEVAETVQPGGRGDGADDFVSGPRGYMLELMGGENTSQSARYRLPGGGLALYWAAGWQAIAHAGLDGGAPLVSMQYDHSLVSATAYAPFGVRYDTAGAAAPYGGRMNNTATTTATFGGLRQEIAGGTYDAAFRELNAIQSRWWTPDPAGLSAVNPANPQSWDAYAYVGNQPLSNVDPDGLCPTGSHDASAAEMAAAIQIATGYEGETHCNGAHFGAGSVDCSGLVMASLAGVPSSLPPPTSYLGMNLTTRNIDAWTDPGTGAVGDIIYFPKIGHVGIVTAPGEFISSTTTQGPFENPFGPQRPYWGNPGGSGAPVFRRACVANQQTTSSSSAGPAGASGGSGAGGGGFTGGSGGGFSLFGVTGNWGSIIDMVMQAIMPGGTVTVGQCETIAGKKSCF